MKKKHILSLLVLFILGAVTGFYDLNAENRSRPVSYRSEKNASIQRRTAKRPDQQITFQWHQRNLVRHFNKHRAEFPEYKNAKEYGDGAVKFFSDPPPGTEFKRRSNGDRLFYYEKSNLFGVTTKDGFIKTFFRPNRGIRYWNRQ